MEERAHLLESRNDNAARLKAASSAATMCPSGTSKYDKPVLFIDWQPLVLIVAIACFRLITVDKILPTASVTKHQNKASIRKLDFPTGNNPFWHERAAKVNKSSCSDDLPLNRLRRSVVMRRNSTSHRINRIAPYLCQESA